MKAKYTKKHPHYGFVLEQTYEAEIRSSEWIIINKRPYRAEYFELSGLLKSFINFVCEYRQIPSNFTSDEAIIITNDFKELEVSAAEYNSKEVQDAIKCSQIMDKLLKMTRVLFIDNGNTVNIVPFDAKIDTGHFVGTSRLDSLQQALEHMKREIGDEKI